MTNLPKKATTKAIKPPHNDNFRYSESWNERRRRIARQAEEACHLKGNLNGPDLEDFATLYGIKNSDFA